MMSNIPIDPEIALLKILDLYDDWMPCITIARIFAHASSTTLSHQKQRKLEAQAYDIIEKLQKFEQIESAGIDVRIIREGKKRIYDDFMDSFVEDKK